MEIILGNILSLCATISDSISGTRKTKKEILLIQCISQGFYMISSLVLKGYSAVVQNVVSIIRNLFAAYDKKNKVIEIILVITPVVLGIYFNNLGLIGYLPIVANLTYSVAVFVIKDNPRKLKYIFVINVFLFSIFNFYILNFVGGVFNIVTLVTTIISLYKTRSK